MVLLDTSGVAAGEHEILIRLFDSQRKELGRKTVKFTKPERPSWLGSNAGLTNKVMPPWTDMEVSDGAVKCWGRTYNFDSEPWPAKIVTQGDAILAGPITINGKAGASHITWGGDKIAFTERSDAEVVLVSRKSRNADEPRWVYLDVGKFGGLAETMDEAIRYPIATEHDGRAEGPVIIAGPTCDGADVLYENAGYTLPLDLETGDRVSLLSAGAYTATYASIGFNGLPPLTEHYI